MCRLAWQSNSASAVAHVFLGCRFDLKEISTVVRVSDPSVPDGYAFWIGLKDRPLGQFFVAGESLQQQECEIRFAWMLSTLLAISDAPYMIIGWD